MLSAFIKKIYNVGKKLLKNQFNKLKNLKSNY